MATLICARCGQEKYTKHEPTAPHGNVEGASECEGYLAAHPCENASDGHFDLEEHEPTSPHPRVIGGQTLCPAAQTSLREPPVFEGGGGNSGGGGSSGGW